MVLVIEVSDVKKIISKIGLENFTRELINETEKYFSLWKEFQVKRRNTFYFKEGVIETMPIANSQLYSVKLVNGHPFNPMKGLLTVAAIGILADVKTGYPLMITEATLLTALRTGATTALATKYLSRKDSRTVGIIGTGAQSEFQVLSVLEVRKGIEKVFCYDIDFSAMVKFKNNIEKIKNVNITLAKSSQEVVQNSDILITATAGKGKRKIVKNEWVKEGTHINAIGGDAKGKTELDPELLKRAKIVVEYLAQTKHEGEIQNLRNKNVYAELWELACGLKKGRINSKEITIFDSVGFALEDWIIYNFVLRLAKDCRIGKNLELIPEAKNPKDLISILLQETENNQNFDKGASANLVRLCGLGPRDLGSNPSAPIG